MSKDQISDAARRVPRHEAAPRYAPDKPSYGIRPYHDYTYGLSRLKWRKLVTVKGDLGRSDRSVGAGQNG